MSKYMHRVAADEGVLAERIRDALADEDLGGKTLNYRLAAHAFLNYLDAVMPTGVLPKKVTAAGHILFALNEYRPAPGEDAGELLKKLDPPLARIAMLATEAAWTYIKECVAVSEKVKVQ